jgi:hypothetical protein
MYFGTLGGPAICNAATSYGLAVSKFVTDNTACEFDQGWAARNLGWTVLGDNVPPTIVRVNADTNQVEETTDYTKVPELKTVFGLRGQGAHRGVVLITGNQMGPGGMATSACASSPSTAPAATTWARRSCPSTRTSVAATSSTASSTSARACRTAAAARARGRRGRQVDRQQGGPVPVRGRREQPAVRARLHHRPRPSHRHRRLDHGLQGPRRRPGRDVREPEDPRARRPDERYRGPVQLEEHLQDE